MGSKERVNRELTNGVSLLLQKPILANIILRDKRIFRITRIMGTISEIWDKTINNWIFLLANQKQVILSSDYGRSTS